MDCDFQNIDKKCISDGASILKAISVFLEYQLFSPGSLFRKYLNTKFSSKLTLLPHLQIERPKPIISLELQKQQMIRLHKTRRPFLDLEIESLAFILALLSIFGMAVLKNTYEYYEALAAKKFCYF